MCQVLCKTNQVLTTLCEKVAKTLEKPKKQNLASNFKHMTTIFNSKHFKTIIYIPNSVVCQVSSQTNQVWTSLCEKVPKTLKKPLKGNLAHNFKHTPIFFYSNHFSTIIYMK